MSSSSSPCAACKFLRRKCTLECVFAPYFPPDQPQKFSNVHKVFGASNVAKILNELSPTQREDAVNSLAYEADARLQDPVYGCVGRISILQSRLRQVQRDLFNAKKELATYIGPSAMLPLLPQIGFMQQQMLYNNNNNNVAAMLGGPTVQMEAQQMAAVAAAREQQEMMMRSYEQQQQQQHEMARFSGGFDQIGVVGGVAGVFNQMPTTSVVSASLALGSSSDVSYNEVHESQQEQFRIPHHQLQLHSQPQSLFQQLNHHEEGSVVGP